MSKENFVNVLIGGDICLNIYSGIFEKVYRELVEYFVGGEQFMIEVSSKKFEIVYFEGDQK